MQANHSEESSVVNQCPECGQGLDVANCSPYSKIECSHCGAAVRVRTRMGQYEITGVLGEGGMSQVFRAVDTHLQREAALKILHQALSEDSALTAMFEREAKLTASILHPNVVKVYTVGKDQGYFFIAMELVDATSLEQLIAAKGALSEAEVWRIAHDVTRGLQAAYGEGLIHRDIKPGNILVTKDGTSKLVDFGLAVQQGGEDESEELWATPFYVPPEKLEGQPDNLLGDIYSLGATLYHALAGKPPFEANTSSMEELKEIKKQAVDLKAVAPSASKASVRLVQSLMSYAPEDRPPNYEEILVRIETLERRQFGAHRGTARTRRRDRRKVVIGVATGALLLVLLGWMVSSWFAEGPGTGDLGFETGDRIIHAGTASDAERFLQARQSLIDGDHGGSRELFDALVESSLSPPNRMWSLFLSGVADLFSGNEEAARSAFGRIGEVDAGEEGETQDLVRFLVRSGEALASPLPIREEETDFDEASVECIGLLAAGLKNWNLHQFESGLDFLKAFEACPVPGEAAWIGDLKAQLEPFLADGERLLALPIPSRRSGEDLAMVRASLIEARQNLRTTGAAPRLIERRLERIGRIEALVEAEREASLAAVPAPAPAPQPAPGSEAGTMPPTQPDAETEADLETLRDLVRSLEPLAENLDFAAAADRLREVELGSGSALAQRELLLDLYLAAADFVPSFAAALVSMPFEGEVRRREGIPLDATVTAASPEVFLVDLGFGQNEVPVSAFAPEWMAEAAAAVMEAPGSDPAGDWWRLVAFTLVAVGPEQANQPAAVLAEADDGFADRWRELRRWFEDSQ